MNNDDGSLQFSSDSQAIRRLSGQFEALNVATTSDKADENPNAFDCSILINGERLWAKKIVLARHSLFFYTKFVLEAYNEIELSDMRVEVLRSVLQFCHYGRVDTCGTDEEILHAANRCQVNALKDMCENRLCISTNELNFVERWRLASECDAKKLSEKCASVHKARQQEMQENILSKAMNVLQLDASNNHMSYIS